MAVAIAKRTPEQWAEIMAKKAATRALQTPEQRASTRAKWAEARARRAAERAAAAQQTDDKEGPDAR